MLTARAFDVDQKKLLWAKHLFITTIGSFPIKPPRREFPDDSFSSLNVLGMGLGVDLYRNGW